MTKLLNGLTHILLINHGKGVNKHNRMKAVANQMMAKDESLKWKYTVEYLDKMDEIRNTNWRETFPS